jgi:multicomponent Na+:H+ antiporter subunit B
MNQRGRVLASLLFVAGLVVLTLALLQALSFGGSPMQVGQEINHRAGQGDIGAANIVTAVVLGYRGFDTLGEVTILFVAATAAGFLLGGAAPGQRQARPAGFVLRAAADLLLPFLLLLGGYIILHGHLTPGGGFQGGAILAAAFFMPLLANPANPYNHVAATLAEGFAGAAFIVIGLVSLLGGDAFLTPLLGKGTLGELFSAGSLPLLYLAIGIKVGSELAGLLVGLAGEGGRA